MFFMRLMLLMVCLLAISKMVVAQSSGNQAGQNTGDNSLAPYHPQEMQTRSAKKKSKKKRAPSGPSYQSEQEYYDRMARLDKEKRKIEKEMDKPQYSDPMYFGHKRPPKKRKAGKLKYCKECGIRH
jgi:hypothetical protein